MQVRPHLDHFCVLLLFRAPSVYSVLLLYWYKSTNTDAEDAPRSSGSTAAGTKVQTLYWYKSTNTHSRKRRSSLHPACGSKGEEDQKHTHFTCFTKVQILTPEEPPAQQKNSLRQQKKGGSKACRPNGRQCVA